ncbi:UNVERIFIED_CONTAM: hypothetical protein BJ099_12530 [Lysinibacillus xylanilyticus]
MVTSDLGNDPFYFVVMFSTQITYIYFGIATYCIAPNCYRTCYPLFNFRQKCQFKAFFVTRCVFSFPFLIPWIIFILHLYKKDKLLLYLFAPFFSIVAIIINTLGFYFGFWEVLPFPNQKILASLPFDLGIYPVLACYLILTFFFFCIF